MGLYCKICYSGLFFFDHLQAWECTKPWKHEAIHKERGQAKIAVAVNQACKNEVY